MRACPVCGGYNNKFIYNINMGKDIHNNLPDRYDVVSCRICGMCYADTSATLDDYNNYYIFSNKYAGEPSLRKEYEQFHGVVKEMLTEIISKDSNVIDIGFGKGELLLMLKQEGYTNLSGLDPSEDSVQQLRKQNINAIQGNVYNITMDTMYDVAFLTGVIEHLLFPEDALKSVYRILKDDCYLILAYPDFSNMKEDSFGIASNFNQEHINYFSECSIQNLCKKCGFIRVAEKRFVSFECNKSIQYGNIDIYKKVLLEGSALNFNKDAITEASIREYIERISIAENQIKNIILKLLKDKEPIVVWGVGQYTRRLLTTTLLDQCDIQYYVDNNPMKLGAQFFGKKIKQPDALYGYDGTIIICSMMYSDEILTQIHRMGLSNDVIVL